MRTIKRTVYNFDELSDDIKTKLMVTEKESQLNIYVDICLYDDMLSVSRELLNKYFGITEGLIKCYYDLDYSQGSGAMIEFDISMIDINKALKGNLTDDEIKLLSDYNTIVKVRHNNSNYYHEYTFDYDFDIEYEYDDNYINGMSEKIDTLLNTFHCTIVNMNCELAKIGYSLLEQPIDEQNIIENLKQYEYYENGEVYIPQIVD